MTSPAARYLIIQRSIWSAFTLDIVDPSGRLVGEVRSPTLFQFRNARLAFHPPGSTAGNVKFDFDKVAYDASVKVLRREFINVDINRGQPVLPLVFAAYVIMELLY